MQTITGRSVNSIADLKALTAGAFPCVRSLGYYAPGDGGGGEFYWDASSSEPDNGGTTIAPASNPATGRWKRLVNGPLSVKWFGADGNNLDDDTNAIEAAIAAIPSSGSVIFPVGTYKITKNIEFPAYISAIFDRGATLNPVSDVTVTVNGEIRAGLYQIFTTGAGLIRGFSNAPFLLPQWWGAKGDGQNDDGPAIQAALDAVPDVGGTIIFSSGHYISTQGFIVKAHGTTITGLRSAYSYTGGLDGTQVEFKGGTTGFDFCMGLPTTDPNYGNEQRGIRHSCKISQLVINGGTILQNGIRMASTNLIEEVGVTACTEAGILLDEGTNQVQINKCSAAGNCVGLYARGLYTTSTAAGI